MNSFLELAKSRTSTRKFSDRKVERELLEKVLEAGNIAPTAKNQQPQRIYVLQSEEALEKINALTRCAFHAPVVLLFAYEETAEWNNPLQEGIHSGVEDVSIVATHVMLQAEDLGLATCWVNYYPNAEVEKAFGLAETEHSVLLMPLGYRADDCPKNPTHEVRKDLGDTVSYI